jgi:arginine deiminase
LAAFQRWNCYTLQAENTIKKNADFFHAAIAQSQYLLPPLPNALYTRDTTCWINGGVTLNPLLASPS